MFEHVKQPKLLDPRWTPIVGKWYCGHCIDPYEGTGWVSKESVKQHVAGDHDVPKSDQEEGYDYLNTEDLWLALQRKHARDAEAVEKFRRALDSMIGPDDFVTDCG